ncbi:MAG: DinB family protein [Micropruina sp.]|nr:DinB family protein [Micropruina sp.]
MTAEPPAVPPDTKDWTWVLERGCPQCHWTPPPPTEVAARVEATIPRWVAALHRPRVNERTDPRVWSTLEYGCHVRDVCRLFGVRLNQLLTEDHPTFADWDQDRAAVDGGYHAQDPGAVADQYTVEAQHTAGLFAAVPDDAWQRRGLRSNGSEFTVATLATYFLHDLEHHLADVNG